MSRWLRIAEKNDYLLNKINKSLPNSNEYIVYLLKNNLISEDDEHYDELINKIVKEYPKGALELIENGIITREKYGTLRGRVIRDYIRSLENDSFFEPEKMFGITDSTDVIDLLVTLTPEEFRELKSENPKRYTRFLNRLLNQSHNSAFIYLLLAKKAITREDGDVFYQLLNKAIEDPDYAYELLKHKIITEEDGELYNKVLNRVKEYS